MNRAQKKVILIIVVLLLAVGYDYASKFFGKGDAGGAAPQTGSIPSPASQQQLLEKIRDAAENRKSGWWLETDGEVVRTLKDDLDGSAHQRFILRLAPDITLLVAHNIDLAKRIPLKKGDRVKLRGRYEWNHKGGVIHWTHHDPDGKQQGGWIECNGKRYQ